MINFPLNFQQPGHHRTGLANLQPPKTMCPRQRKKNIVEAATHRIAIETTLAPEFHPPGSSSGKKESEIHSSPPLSRGNPFFGFRIFSIFIAGLRVRFHQPFPRVADNSAKRLRAGYNPFFTSALKEKVSAAFRGKSCLPRGWGSALSFAGDAEGDDLRLVCLGRGLLGNFVRAARKRFYFVFRIRLTTRFPRILDALRIFSIGAGSLAPFRPLFPFNTGL